MTASVGSWSVAYSRYRGLKFLSLAPAYSRYGGLKFQSLAQAPDLKPKTSSGIDDISVILTKNRKKELTVPLTNIDQQQKLVATAQSPSYQLFQKIIVMEQLLHYLNHNKLLTHQQHGFLKDKLTTMAMIHLVEYILDRLEEGCAITSLFHQGL
ncbi:hypothetical protein J6590_079585 [Homalodisca vitripennis]|nr:hypothetical protein J6590_079585 [Homalodisca vitripennis]